MPMHGMTARAAFTTPPLRAIDPCPGRSRRAPCPLARPGLGPRRGPRRGRTSPAGPPEALQHPLEVDGAADIGAEEALAPVVEDEGDRALAAGQGVGVGGLPCAAGSEDDVERGCGRRPAVNLANSIASSSETGPATDRLRRQRSWPKHAMLELMSDHKKPSAPVPTQVPTPPAPVSQPRHDGMGARAHSGVDGIQGTASSPQPGKHGIGASPSQPGQGGRTPGRTHPAQPAASAVAPQTPTKK